GVGRALLVLDGMPFRVPRHVKTLPLFGQDDPDIRARIPGPSVIVAEHVFHGKPGALEAGAHLPDAQRAERELETMGRRTRAAALDVPLIEGRQVPPWILTDRFDKLHGRAARHPAAKLHLVPVLAPLRDVGHEVDGERAAAFEDARDRRQRVLQIALANQRLENAVRREDHREARALEWKMPDVRAHKRWD